MICIEEIEEKKHVLIYGCGAMGRNLKNKLNLCGVNVECFMVSDNYREKVKVCDIPVVELSEYIVQDDSMLIISMNSESKKRIDLTPIKGKMAIVDSEKIDIISALDKVFKTLCRNEKILINDSIIEIKNVRIGNPCTFEKSEVYESFLAEYNDVLQTGSYVEGPYLCNNVDIKQGDICLDLGANIGLFSAAAASHGGKVYSFEPSISTIHSLKYICKEYMDSIQVIPAAVMEYSGNTEFYLDGDAGTGNSALFNLGGGKAINVPCVALDDFVVKNRLPRIDFIKADIEGAERNMLCGAQRVLAQYGPKLALCTYHRPDDKEVMTNLILKANPNYVIEYKYEKLYAYIP